MANSIDSSRKSPCFFVPLSFLLTMAFLRVQMLIQTDLIEEIG